MIVGPAIVPVVIEPAEVPVVAPPVIIPRAVIIPISADLLCRDGLHSRAGDGCLRRHRDGDGSADGQSECHRAAAQPFRGQITHFNPFPKLGTTICRPGFHGKDGNMR